jgi:hypothetical protein
MRPSLASSPESESESESGPPSASPLTVALALLALPLALDAAVVLLEDAGADVAAVADRERCDVVLA